MLVSEMPTHTGVRGFKAPIDFFSTVNFFDGTLHCFGYDLHVAFSQLTKRHDITHL